MAFLQKLKSMMTIEENSNLAVDPNSLPKLYQSENSAKVPEEVPVYNSGFENIYALKNIDVKTIRKIGERPAAPIDNKQSEKNNFKKEENKKVPVCYQKKEKQPKKFNSTLDLYDDNIMTALVLEEPISQLNLSGQASKSCLDNDINIIGDIFRMEKEDSFEGIACGHIDEIVQKSHGYTGDIDLYNVREVDFESLVKCLIGDLDPLAIYCFLKGYSLEGLVRLTNENIAQFKVMKSEDISRLSEKGCKLLRQTSKRDFVEKHCSKIFHFFFRGWMMSRYCVASYDDIIERLVRVSLNAKVVFKVMDLIQALYYEESNYLANFFNEVDSYTYTWDNESARRYKLVSKRADTYFYNYGLRYDLHSFIKMLSAEFARGWLGFEEGFVEHVLKISPAFRIRKAEDQKLYISRA